MYKIIFGGVLMPSDDQLAFLWICIGLLLAFPTRWILNICLKKSVIGWSVVCLFIAVGMFIYNLFSCAYFYRVLGGIAASANPPTQLAAISLGLNPLCAYTLAYVFFDGSRWKRRCSKYWYQLIYHANTPFQIALPQGKQNIKLRNIYMGRYVATRVFVCTFWINFISLWGFFSTYHPAYIWLMMLINALSLPSTIYAFVFAIRKRERWFFNMDERIARHRHWYDIDKYTNINAQGEEDEWIDDKLKKHD